jgi:hypothetical protein
MSAMSSSNPFSRAAFTYSPAAFFLPILDVVLAVASKRFWDSQDNREDIPWIECEKFRVSLD